MNSDNKHLPLVYYDDQGERTVIGTAELKDDNTVENIVLSATITHENFKRALIPDVRPGEYSIVAEEPDSISLKENVLVEAEKIIHGQRRKDYGSAEKSFRRIWDLWLPILESESELSGPEKVALCMIQLKVARYVKSKDRDSVVDIAGYAGCLAQIKGWEDD